MMQGQRDLKTVSRLIMSELTPLVGAQHGAFFVARGRAATERAAPAGRELRLQGAQERRERASSSARRSSARRRSRSSRSCSPRRRTTTSGSRPALGESAPRNIIVLPVLFEDQVMAVIELASFHPLQRRPADVPRAARASRSASCSTRSSANMRTEELLEQSQRSTQELQSQSEELQAQQEELQQRNEELEEQAATLKRVGGAAPDAAGGAPADERGARGEGAAARGAERADRAQEPRDRARARALEEKAEQLALSSKYKSEFLANMSHELRTPLNSLLILAKLLGDNPDGNLTDKQIEFAQTIHSARLGPARPDQRHPRPLEGRGREDGRRNLGDVPLARAPRARRAGVPAVAEQKRPRVRGRDGANVAADDRRPTSSGSSRC